MQADSRRTRRQHKASGNDAVAPWYRLPAVDDDGGTIIIIGAGLAGCALARSLAERGRHAIVLDAGAGPASAASGNPAGVVKPFVTRAPSEAQDFYHAAWSELQAWLDRDGLGESAGYAAIGAVQLTRENYPPGPGFEVFDQHTAASHAGVALPSGGIHFSDAGWLDPSALCRGMIEQASSRAQVDVHYNTRVSSISRANERRWQIALDDETTLLADQLVLANGIELSRNRWTDALPLLPARGQISRFRVSETPRCVVAGKHYAIPLDDTLYVGASFDRGDEDDQIRDADHASNLAGLRALLPTLSVDPEPVSGHAGVRATTPDRLPLIGPVADHDRCQEIYADLARGRAPDSYPALPVHSGLSVLGGFGSRGIVTAPFAATLLADWLCGGSALQAWMPLLSPVRFQIRDLRSGRSVQR